MPSKFGHELHWLTCESLLAQRLAHFILLHLRQALPFRFYQLLHFAIDFHSNFFHFGQGNFDVNIWFFAGFEAEVRLPVEMRAPYQTTHGKENENLYTYHALSLLLYLWTL